MKSDSKPNSAVENHIAAEYGVTFLRKDGNSMSREENVGYIHFAGVHPQFRRVGIGRLLFEQFFSACKANGRSIVKSCTSPVNKLSIGFHQRMGFEIEPGDAMVDGVPVSLNHLGKDNPKVLFKRRIG